MSIAAVSLAQQVMLASANLNPIQKKIFDQIFRQGQKPTEVLSDEQLRSEYQGLLRSLKASCGRELLQ